LLISVIALVLGFTGGSKAPIAPMSSNMSQPSSGGQMM
jgi:hypothetical protein